VAHLIGYNFETDFRITNRQKPCTRWA